MDFVFSDIQMAMVMSASLASPRLPLTDSPGSAKCGTSLLVALLALVSPHGRIVIAEDRRSWRPNHPHAVLIEGRLAKSEVGGAISRTDLVLQSLSMHPDRLAG
jgi:Flp pilus assembly CpaF family ATPase